MPTQNLTVLIRGAGELASGVAYRLARSHFQVCLTEIPQPLAVRRGVSFSEAVHEGQKEVEGITAELISSPAWIMASWNKGRLPLLIDPGAKVKEILKPDILVDATLAKKNLGTRISDAPLVIGLGVGFYAGKDVHAVIETNRGHNLGRVIRDGRAEPDTGIPGEIAGVSVDRILRAPHAGKFFTERKIGEMVEQGDIIAAVEGQLITTKVSGIIRGLLRDGATVSKGLKVGDIDPRGVEAYCFTISDKSRAISGGVLEAIMARFNV